jgi:hypothetical protein
LYPEEALKEGESEEAEDEEDEDIEDMIAKEVKAMSNKPKSKKRFVSLHTDTDCGKVHDNILVYFKRRQILIFNLKYYSSEQIHLSNLFLSYITL